MRRRVENEQGRIEAVGQCGRESGLEFFALPPDEGVVVERVIDGHQFIERRGDALRTGA